MPPSMTRRAVIASGAALCGAGWTAAWGAGVSGTLSPSDMRADVALLRRAYEALHPGLLRYRTAAESAAGFDRLADAARAPMGLAAFYLLLSRHLATLRCGHSYVNFYNQSKAVRAALFDAPDRLPLEFLWLDGRMVVTADPWSTGIAPGSEVLSMEGRPAGAVLESLMTIARADGGNDVKRRRLLSVQGEDGYETFDVFHSLMFGGRPRYRLEVAGPDGRRRSAAVEAVTLEQRRAVRPKPVDASGDAPVWTMERRGGTAVLTMPNWGLYNSKWDWSAWIDREMDRLIDDGVRLLVIDVRRNEGGLDCGDRIVARLIDRPVAASPYRRLVRYRRIPDDLRPRLDTWDRSFDDWGADATPVDDRYLALKRGDEEGAVISPRGRRFAGEVAVLVGPQNSSATFQFAQLMRRERLGRLVGETTGGNRRGINGGAFYFLRLPATGLEVDLPLIGYFPSAPEPDGGLEPDEAVRLTAAHVAAGRDPVLEAVA